MKILLSIAVLLKLATLQSCIDENSNNDSNPKIIWETSLTDGKLMRADVNSDIQYNGGVLLSGTENGSCLYFVNIEDGKIRWKWNDYLPTDLGWVLYRQEKYYGSLIHLIKKPILMLSSKKV